MLLECCVVIRRLAPGSMFGNESPPEWCVLLSSSNLVNKLLKLIGLDLERGRRKSRCSARKLKIELLAALGGWWVPWWADTRSGDRQICRQIGGCVKRFSTHHLSVFLKVGCWQVLGENVCQHV
jgi:hypothetical protein